MSFDKEKHLNEFQEIMNNVSAGTYTGVMQMYEKLGNLMENIYRHGVTDGIAMERKKRVIHQQKNN